LPVRPARLARPEGHFHTPPLQIILRPATRRLACPQESRSIPPRASSPELPRNPEISPLRFRPPIASGPRLRHSL
jgi:hypothetical protein